MATFKINKIFKNGKISKAHELIEAETEEEAKEQYVALHGKKYKVFGLQVAEVQPSLATVEGVTLLADDVDVDATQLAVEESVHEACHEAA